ncbi:hypothetical protein M758_N027500 [Ceratodon purpureus]|nr:hypothetical protein M758_N027500 [Ceratodon purpureus]
MRVAAPSSRPRASRLTVRSTGICDHLQATMKSVSIQAHAESSQAEEFTQFTGKRVETSSLSSWA